MIKKFLIALVLISLASFVSAAQISVNQPDVCYACHGEMESLMDKKNVHAAFEGGTCSDCHNPHASKHASLLNEDVNKLCLECHDDFEQKLKETSVHDPITSENCLSCHDPHASDHAALKRFSKQELCTYCHDQVSSWPDKPVQHQPVAQNKCEACHDPHASNHEKLELKAVPELCIDCHTVTAALKTKHKGIDISRVNCITCHDPHVSTMAGLLMPNQHRPFENNQCKSCHEMSGQEILTTMKDNSQDLCAKCHRTIEKSSDRGFVHMPDDANPCLNCHNPHASANDALLAKDQATLCLGCHFNEEGMKSKTKFITHPDLECSSCHQPHGSNVDKYLIKENLDLCSDCHADAHASSHPVGVDVIDPRNNESITCLTCHVLHGSEYEKYLILDPKMDLCIQCHKR